MAIAPTLRWCDNNHTVVTYISAIVTEALPYLLRPG